MLSVSTKTSITDFYIDQKLIDLPDDDKTSYFSRRDRRLLKKYKKSNVKVLKSFNKTPYKFRIFIVDAREVMNNISPQKYYHKYNCFETNDDIVGFGSSFNHKFGIYSKSGEITVIYMSNMVGDSVSVTPWILSHRFVHSVYNGSLIDYDTKISQKFTKTLGIFSDLCEWYHSSDEYNENNLINTYYKFFDTGSARAKNLDSDVEASVEILTEFIIKGKITMITPSDFSENGKKFVKNIEDKLNRYSKETLDACVGNIFIAL